LDRKSKQFRPYSYRLVRSPREDKVYFCQLYRPHILAEAINTNFSTLATYYAVNIGAGDGLSYYDPVYPLFQKGFAGIAVEAGENQELFKNLPSAKVKKLTGVYVTPQNISTILDSSGCPKQCDFFKIDIDGYDGSILKTTLELGYRPKVIQIEVNPEFPPPIEFAVLYHPSYRAADNEGRLGGFYGASLSYVMNLTKDYGYRLAYLDFVTGWTHDVTLVQQEFFDLAVNIFGHDIKTKSPRELYLRQPPCYPHFVENGIDSFAWRHRTDYDELLSAVRDACLKANAMKHGDLSVPFHLSLSVTDEDSRYKSMTSQKPSGKVRSQITVVVTEAKRPKLVTIVILLWRDHVKLPLIGLWFVVRVGIKDPSVGLLLLRGEFRSGLLLFRETVTYSFRKIVKGIRKTSM